LATGGILRWKDGRNMPDVHAMLFEYGNIPVYMRLNLGTETQEGYRIMGSKGLLEVTPTSIKFTPQSGNDDGPSWYSYSFPKNLRTEFMAKWHAEHDAVLSKEAVKETDSFTGPSYDETKPHLWNFFEAVRTRKPVMEDVVFGHHAALACH